VKRMAAGVCLTRDLINTPAQDLGPEELAEAAKAMARPHKAKVKVIVGKGLLSENYPSVHAVGRAAAQEPRLIDITWGKGGHPRVTLVGKGVCFDSGGLDIKPAGGMLNMKKDMGGAAQVLGLAHMIMDAKLPVRLRVLVPAVENAISSNAFHPKDILQTRKGLTVEVGNTDAEGRLILSDALTEAASDKPAMIIDFATLTGAARVALGSDVPALFCNDDVLADAMLSHGMDANDPLWRMPLWQGYKHFLSSPIADISSTGSAPNGGAITAALFLEHFVEPDVPWAHIDLMAFNNSSRPGRPEGGEAQGIRGIYAMLKSRYG
jgi:leucyl aminopeptidase